MSSKKTLDWISATPHLIDSLSIPSKTQEEAKTSWILTYLFIKKCLEEDELNRGEK